jgi:hypothetical protein
MIRTRVLSRGSRAVVNPLDRLAGKGAVAN